MTAVFSAVRFQKVEWRSGLKSPVVVILVAAVMAIVGQVHATDADDLVRQGLSLRHSHHDDEALKLFEQAYAMEPTLRTLVQRYAAPAASVAENVACTITAGKFGLRCALRF